MSHTNQFEPSIRSAELLNNTNKHTDLDDVLIGQALSILQSQSTRSVDNVLPSVVRAQTLESRHSDKFDPANIPNTRELIRGLVDGPIESAPIGIRNGKADRAVTSGVGETIGSMVGRALQTLPRFRHNDQSDPANIRGVGDGLRSIIDGMLPPLPEVRPNDKSDGSVIRGIGDGIKDGAGVIGKEGPSDIGRGFGSLIDKLGLPRNSERMPMGLYACRMEVPWPKIDMIRPPRGGPSEVHHCTYELPNEWTSPRNGREIPGAPSEPILCTARLPIDGKKPDPGNYYLCVHYYPLKQKDLIIPD